MKQDSIWWIAPEYFSRWRLFPRAFISMYIYLLYEVCTWFMALAEPNNAQAGLVSVVVGAGAAWFGLYVNSTSSKHTPPVVVPQQAGSMPSASVSTPKAEPVIEEDNDLPPPKRRM
jgi:hypothetical protein